MTTEVDDVVRAELSARITFQQESIERWAAAVDRPPQVAVVARTRAGFAWFDVGVCRLLLGDAAAAAGAFARSAGYVHSALEVAPVPALATYTDALESAVVSGDRALAERIAAAPVPPEPKPFFTGDRLAWALALPALVTGADTGVRAQAEAANGVPEKKAWYPGIGDAMAALVAGDAARLAAALERVLAKHTAYATAEKSWCYNSGPCLLCIPAVVLLRLAAWRGIAVGDVPGHRATIPLGLTHTAQGSKHPFDVDFTPAALVTP